MAISHRSRSKNPGRPSKGSRDSALKCCGGHRTQGPRFEGVPQAFRFNLVAWSFVHDDLHKRVLGKRTSRQPTLIAALKSNIQCHIYLYRLQYGSKMLIDVCVEFTPAAKELPGSNAHNFLPGTRPLASPIWLLSGRGSVLNTPNAALLEADCQRLLVDHRAPSDGNEHPRRLHGAELGTVVIQYVLGHLNVPTSFVGRFESSFSISCWKAVCFFS